MRALVRLWPLALVGGIASCAFLLDYDELQGGSDDAGADVSSGGSSGSGGTATGGTAGVAGTGGSGGTAGSSGTGGTGGDAGVACTKPGPSSECDDGDDCTIDICVIDDAGPPRCFSQGKLVAEGQADTTVPGLDSVTLAGSGGHFWLSTLAAPSVDSGAAHETAIRHYPNTSGTLAEQHITQVALEGADTDTRSVAGLQYHGGKLHAFTAVQQGATGAYVKRTSMAADLTGPQSAALSTPNTYEAQLYWFPHRHPMPFATSKGLGVIWINTDGIWAGGDPANQPKAALIAGTPTDIVPVYTDDAVGAFWRNYKSSVEKLQVTLVNSSGAQSVTFPNCQPSKISEGISGAGLGGLFTLSHARYALLPYETVASLHGTVCTGASCSALTTCSEPGAQYPGSRLPMLTTFTRGPVPGRIYFASASFGADDSFNLSAWYLDPKDGRAAKFSVPAIPGAPAVGARPAIAYSDDRLLVAWKATSDQLRVRRYKFECPPQ